MSRIESIANIIYGYVTLKGVITTDEVRKDIQTNFLSISENEINSTITELTKKNKIVRITLNNEESGEMLFFLVEPRQEYFIRY